MATKRGRVVAVAIIAAFAIGIFGPEIEAAKKNDHSTKVVEVAFVRGYGDTEDSPGGFVDLPRARTSVFTEDKGRIIVRFNAESRCVGPAGSQCLVRVLVDGAEASPIDSPGAVFNSGGTGGWVSSSLERSVNGVRKGRHIVVVQWATVGDPSTTFHIGSWHVTAESFK